jgi:hypothetical protein
MQNKADKRAGIRPGSILIVLLIALLASLTVFAQEREIEAPNFKKIKKQIRKKKSAYYYPELFQRYVDLDTSLSAEDFKYLYYGFTFQKEYKPYGTPVLRDSLASYLKRENMLAEEYRLAAGIAGDLLQESPFRLRETFIAAVAYEMAGDEAMSSIYFDFFEKQVDAIMSSGDGLSDETAFFVIYIPDEYEILEVLGFKYGGEQSLTTTGCDLLKIAENQYGIGEIYFNVSRLLEVGN